MGLSKKLYMKINEGLEHCNMQYELLRSKQEEEEYLFKHNKKHEKIQYTELHKVQGRCKK